MALKSVLVANRGEIAVRIERAAAELGIRSVAVYAEDDARSLHVRRADDAVALGASGPGAYLDADGLVAAAVAARCDAVHPGYGFLSEHAGFARACTAAGLTFVGPRPGVLELFGDKARGRAFAETCSVPVLAGTVGPTTLDEAAAFLEELGPGAAVMVKAVAGGGGRGMRVVRHPDELATAYERCRSEALGAFGLADVYVEQLLPRARHVEVQVLGDRTGSVVHLGERECSLQRRHQKIVEIAPAPGLSERLRARLHDAAVRLATAAGIDNAATIEFLVHAADGDDAAAAFIEANPRLQVEHTVTEEVTGVDLVQAQLRLAGGATLADLGLVSAPTARGTAIQARVTMETLGADGTSRPSSGTLTAFEVPSGPGVRVDSFGYAGYRTSTRFDPLLAKLIAHSPSSELGDAAGRARRALREFRVTGVDTTIPFLLRLLAHPDVVAGRLHTGFVEEHLATLVPPLDVEEPLLHFDGSEEHSPAALVGRRVDTLDPLAVLDLGRSAPREDVAPATTPVPEGTVAVPAPLQGTVVALEAAEGDEVVEGAALVVMEAMKMEHVVAAPVAGVVRRVAVGRGDTVPEGHVLVHVEAADVVTAAATVEAKVDLDAVRPDLAEVLARQAGVLDAARPDAAERRRRTGQRTARENVDDLCDLGSYVEYAPLVIAAQRRRRSVQELVERTPADGMLAGIGTVNAGLFGGERTHCAVMSYDYTVLAGTQGQQNHRKKDRLFEIAERQRLPVVFFTEGGGGRPGDTDGLGVAGLDCMAFHLFGRLSGLVPLVGIASGRCFAGNAAILGCCDVVIATEGSTIGMGGPAMIEGGGLGVFRPEEVGPLPVQVANGVVDVPVADEAEAVRVAKQYLSYFQGALPTWTCADQRLLRAAVPEHRLRVYDVRNVVHTLCDTGSVLELRRAFGPGMVTALARIEGRPVGVIANDPRHLAGAIDSDGADKAARFMQLCDAFDLPILFLCDTPGIMVGPDAERTGLVRHASRLFVTAGSLTVPFFTIVLRKGYGLGAQAMAGGSFKAPVFTVAWPTGEFGGMGLEGAVKLGYRNELAAVPDPVERRALFDEMVARMYEHGRALNVATHFEIDDVIDPAASRRWISAALRSSPPPPPRTGKKRPCVDTW
jgi:acetyl/propionyl-CoA carboxylase alpha subunit/acetyl-CoA carboxylase carboxyltransferase component